MSEGIIELGSDKANELGFTSDLFAGWLWEKEDELWISFIASNLPGKGNFKRLIKTALAKGYTIVIPTPLGRMETIVRKNGFKRKVSALKEGPMAGEPLETWTLKPKKG